MRRLFEALQEVYGSCAKLSSGFFNHQHRPLGRHRAEYHARGLWQLAHWKGFPRIVGGRRRGLAFGVMALDV
jgi:hypothetical protein